MRLNLLFTSLLLSISPVVFGQESVNASASNISSSAGSVSYSVGQVAFQYSSNGQAVVSQGVQQPFELLTLELKKDQLPIAVSVFPNPSSDYFILEFPQEHADRAFRMLDLNGRLLMSGELSGLQNSIPANDLTPAQYFIEITEGNATQTFKLIKN